MPNLKYNLQLAKERLENTYLVISDRFLQAEKRNAENPSKWLEKEMQESFEATEAIRHFSESNEAYINFLEKWVNDLLRGRKLIENELLGIESAQRIQLHGIISEIRHQRGLSGVSKDQELLVVDQLKSLKRIQNEANTAKNKQQRSS